VWPELCRQASRERRTLVCVDESGFYLLPGWSNLWAERADPGYRQEVDPGSSFGHGGSHSAGNLYTLVRQRSLKSPESVVFLKHLLVQTGQKLLVIWDGSPIHRWGAVQEFLAEGGAKRVHLEAMPGYAPDLSPLDQGCWQHLITCGDAEPLVYGHGRVAFGLKFCKSNNSCTPADNLREICNTMMVGLAFPVFWRGHHHAGHRRVSPDRGRGSARVWRPSCQRTPTPDTSLNT